MLHIPVLVLGVAATIAFLILRVKKGGLPAAVAKTCASVMFVLTGIAAAMDSMPYFKEPVIGLSKFNPWVMLFIAGLVCAVLGDLFLDLKYTYLEDSDAHTFLGFSFFIATQVFYFMAMQNVFLWKNDPKFIYIPFGVAVIFVLCVIFGEKKILKVTFGKFKAISAVYSGILSFTTAFAKLVDQRTHQGIVIFVQTGNQIVPAGRPGDLVLVDPLEGFLNLLVQLITVGYNQHAAILAKSVRQQPLG